MKVPWELLQLQDNPLNFRKLGWRPKHISFRSQEVGRLAGIWETYKLNTHENTIAQMPSGCKSCMIKIKAFIGRIGRGRLFKIVCNQSAQTTATTLVQIQSELTLYHQMHVDHGQPTAAFYLGAYVSFD